MWARNVVLIASLLISTSAHAQELMPADSTGWSSFAPRPETAPAVTASAAGTGYTLEIAGNNVANVYGGWKTRIEGLQGGTSYRFRARAVTTDIPVPRESVTIVLRWRGAFGDEVAPDYVWEPRVQQDESLLFDRVVRAPAHTTAVEVELVLQWAPAGRVAFDALSFTPASAPAARPVKIASIYFRPSGSTSGLHSVQKAADYGAQVAAQHQPDVMVFGELLNVIGAPGSYDLKAEAIPGPSTDVMAGLARAYGVHVAFGMLERDGGTLYNAAVLMNGDGEIIGKYRKVQLPLQEASVGISPGSSVPVFDTAFGRVALLICQDLSFPEPAREAAMKGAELLLVPIWGGKPALVHARAIEHSVYVAASGYDYYSEVVNPLGTVLDVVDTLTQPGAAVATIDLAQRFREIWLGDWRDIANKERRSAPYTFGTSPPDVDPPSDTTPPSVAIQSPASGATVSGSVSVSATAADDVGVTRVRFAVDGVAVGSDDTTVPYSATWDTTSVANGAHTVTATAFDAAGNESTAMVTVTVSNGTVGSTPYTGTPVALPGRVQAENFDNGGANVAYRDVTAGNSGGAYRATDVDIEATTDTGGGYNVGWMATGEWLVYSVTVATAGTYRVDLRVAASGTGGRLHVEFDGVDKTGPVSIPDTGGWQRWTTVGVPVTLAAGAQRMRVVIDAASSAGVVGNVNYIDVVSTTATPEATDIVIYANDVPATGLHGAWSKTADATSPAGIKLSSANTGVAHTSAPLASPTHYVDVSFTPVAATPYRLWLRLKALNDEKVNDSVWVQFSSARVNDTSVYLLNSTSGLLVNLATDSTATSLSNWGWQNGAYWLSQPTTFTFDQGTQTMRIQVREDGVQIDQIVLSPSTYLKTAPGGPTNDTTIVPKP